MAIKNGSIAGSVKLKNEWKLEGMEEIDISGKFSGVFSNLQSKSLCFGLQVHSQQWLETLQ